MTDFSMGRSQSSFINISGGQLTCSDRVRNKGSLIRYVKLLKTLISSKSGHDESTLTVYNRLEGLRIFAIYKTIYVFL